MGTSSAAKPKGIRRIRAAVRQEQDGRQIVQAVLNDVEADQSIVRSAFGSLGPVAALVTAYRLADRVAIEGARPTIERIASSEGVDTNLPGLLLGITRIATKLVSGAPGLPVLDDLAKRALIETIGGALQGNRRGLDIPRDQLVRNLEAAVAQAGVTGLLSAFIGNYLASLALFYTGELIARQLGDPGKQNLIRRIQLHQADVRTRSTEVGRRIAQHIVGGVAADTLRTGSVEEVSRRLSRLIREAVSELTEEFG